MTTQTFELKPELKKILRLVSQHQPVTGRDVSLDVNKPEAKVKKQMSYLQHLGLIRLWFNGHALVAEVTEQGSATVALMHAERRARADHEALLAAADASLVVECPSCHGQRVYCDTCTGSRFVVGGEAGSPAHLDDKMSGA